MTAAAAGFDAFYFVDNISARRHLAEHAIAPALGIRRGVVQKIIIADVDEKLCGGRMRVAGACHGDGVTIVLELVVSLVFDRCKCAFLFHTRFEAAALNHEAINYTVEDRVVVMTAFYVGEKVFRGKRRFGGIQFDTDDAVICMQIDHVNALIWLQVCRNLECVRLQS